MSKTARALWAIATKETWHALRDRLTLILLVSVPLVQLLLFGFAINLNPRNLPTVLVSQDQSTWANEAVQQIEALGYLKIIARSANLAEARTLLAQSKVQFVVSLPNDFGAQLEAGGKPTVTLIADATDPVATIAATQALKARFANERDSSLVLQTELAFNPQGASRLFIIPGLLGVILTLTLVLLGALAMVREREQGSLDMLDSLGLSRGTLLLGKALPYFVIGCALFALLLWLCMAMLKLPWPAAWATLMVTALLFIAANLALGFFLSQLAKNAMQAMQLGIFFYLPSMLLSGFMFPFHGMPDWAKAIGEALPLTHFLRVVRGILLKNLDNEHAWPLVWPIAVFAIALSAAAYSLSRYMAASRKT